MKVNELLQTDEGARGVLGAAIFGTVVASAVGNYTAPKITIDGNTYDKAISTSYTMHDVKPKKKSVEIRGDKKEVLYWTQPSGKHGRTANLYYPVDQKD